MDRQTTKQNKETYYDILNVPKGCNEKDIKNAYVKLSKKYHPDVKGTANNEQQTARFVKISEAYQTLSKSKSRREYDESLRAQTRFTRNYDMGSSMGGRAKPWVVTPDIDPNPGPFYGIKGIKRVSNFKVAAALTAVAIIGGIFGVFSVRHSFNLNKKNLDEISIQANEHHQRIRSEAQNSTKEEQIRRVIERIALNESRR